MQSSSIRSRGGRHRKVNASQTAKGRIALVTVAAGTVSSAGIGGATAAQINAAEVTEQDATVDAGTTDVDYTLANDADTFLPEVGAAPQILEINEFRPVANLAEQLDKAVAHSTERIAEDLSSRLPSVVKLAEGAFTSGFGPRWGSFHNGIDIANANGTPILAIMDGTVLDSGPASGYGNWIRIQHDDGTISLYGHMESLDVSTGQRVHAGQKIAGMGNLGFSTGTHLHSEVHPGGGGPVDPAAWLAERGIHVYARVLHQVYPGSLKQTRRPQLLTAYPATCLYLFLQRDKRFLRAINFLGPKLRQQFSIHPIDSPP